MILVMIVTNKQTYLGVDAFSRRIYIHFYKVSNVDVVLIFDKSDITYTFFFFTLDMCSSDVSCVFNVFIVYQ